jgi:hypothetical protein
MAIAAWWRREALGSKTPETFHGYAENQELLANDMRAHPASYTRVPLGTTDWNHYQRAEPR